MLPHQFRRLIDTLRFQSSAIEEGLKSQERAIRETSHEANEKRGEIPGIIARAVQHASYEEGEYEKRQRDKEYRQQFVILAATCWTAVFTALAFGAAAYYAHISKGQLDQMAKQYPELQKSATAASNAAKAAQDAVATAERQMELSQRPWLEIHIGGVEPKDTQTTGFTERVGDPFRVPVTISNVGNTAAKRITIVAEIQLVPKGQFPTLGRFINPTPMKGAVEKVVPTYTIRNWRLLPKEPLTRDVVRCCRVSGGKIIPAPFTPNEANEFLAKNLYVLIFGEGQYFDGFGVQHWTRFCMTSFIDATSAGHEQCAKYPDDDNNWTGTKDQNPPVQFDYQSSPK